MGSHGDSWSVFMGADLVFPASIHLLMSNLPKHSLSRSQRERAEAAPGSQARHLSADSSAGADSLASSSVKTLLVVLTLIALWCWHFVLTDASLCWVLFWLMMGLCVASLTLPRVSQHFPTSEEHWNFIRIANWRRIAHGVTNDDLRRTRRKEAKIGWRRLEPVSSYFLFTHCALPGASSHVNSW